MPVTFHYDSNSHTCSFFAPSEKNGKGEREFRCPMAPIITWAEFNSYAQAAVDNLKSESPDSIIEQVEILKNIQRYAIAESTSLPKCALEWDEFLIGHFEFTLDDLGPSGKRTPETRISRWSSIERFYNKLQTHELIPKDAYIPSRHLSDGNNMPRKPRTPVGKLSKQISETSGRWSKEALVSRDLCLDEDEFLCRISQSLCSAIQATIDGCCEYLEKMKTAHELGRKLIEKVDPAELNRRITSGDYYADGVHVADPKSKNCLPWVLAVANYFLKETEQLNSISYVALSNIDFFKDLTRKATKDEYSKLIRQAIGHVGIHTVNSTENFSRLLGHLSARDCAAIASILMIDQPKFPSTGLQGAKLTTSEGTPLIEVQIDERAIQFAIEKPRADQFQVETLTARSAEMNF